MSTIEQRKIRASKLREIEPYLKIVDKIRDFGLTVPELILEKLPDELSYIPARVREVFTYIISKKDLIFDEIRNLLSNIPNIELLVRYIVLTVISTTGVKDFRAEKLYNTLREVYYDIKPFIENPEYQYVENISRVILDKYGRPNDYELMSSALSRYVYAIRKITRAYKCNVFEWILKMNNVREMENNFRIFFKPKFNERKRRALRTLIRLFTHETNVPIAVTAIKLKSYRHYVPIVDMYSTLTTMRSGAFLILKVDSDKVRKIELMLKKVGNEEFKIRLTSVKGIVRSVAKLSQDPILYERGSFYIGYKYCSKLNCSECPINEVCLKYTNIVIK